MTARVAVIALGAVFLLIPGTSTAWAHGDGQLVNDVVTLAPGASATFDGELHYHRLVGEVSADGPVRVRLVERRSGDDVTVIGPGTRLEFNELVRCCDEAWAMHMLVLDNLSHDPVIVTARVRLVHDDLAVMADGAESGTRTSIVLMGLAWWALAWRALRRRPADVALRRPLLGAMALSTFVLGLGTYAAVRYGVGGAPAVVAGNGDVPVLPVNPIISRASLLTGLVMIGWAAVGLGWVRARATTSRQVWLAIGAWLVGAVVLVAVAVTQAYGSPWVQVAWVIAAVPPVILVLAVSAGGRREQPVGS